MGKKKKYRGHYCWVCGRIRPNESFSGKGHRDHICKKCAGQPKEALGRIKDERFVYGVLEQKNISSGNVNRLEVISRSYDDALGKIAGAIAAAGRVHPARKKRIGHLYFKHRGIFDELVRLGIIEDYLSPAIEEERRYEKEYEEYAYRADRENPASIDGKEIDESYRDNFQNEELPF